MSPAKRQALLVEAVALHRAGDLDGAEKRYREVRDAQPKDFDALHLSGFLAHQQGRPNDAVDLLTRAHRLDRKSIPCELRLGVALIAAGRPADGESHLREVTRRNPESLEAWDSLAFCLKAQDRLVEAIECHEKTVALDPGRPGVWFSYGLTLALFGRLPEALRCHERALALDPAFASARLGRAQVLHRSNRLTEAIADYEKFLERQPAHLEARSCRLFALQHVDGISRERLFAEHLAYGRAAGPPVSAPSFFPLTADRRMRVGIWSPDLRTHSCAYFIEPLLRHLDPAQFEVCLYHDHFREDEVSARLRALAASWRNIVGWPNAAVEAAIRSDAPDLLIDLAGHTGMTNRLPLFARRLAPVQITYLGYPDTTGVPAMDYRFTDARADPPGDADRFATEKLVRFAPTAWAYQPPAEAPDPREAARPRNTPPTFGSFSNLAKITDSTLALWARLLATAPEARLLLKGHGLDEPDTKAAWLARLARAGLPADRLELVGRLPGPAAHLALYHRVDVALDTFPYHGTTTTCEALWMGVPVVSLAGNRHVSRVGVSLLHAVGHPEWIAVDEDAYVQIAARLAAEPVEPAAVRAAMRRSPLLDHAGQAARFGAALRACWVQRCSGAAAAA
jgi:Flp pilus assembly protein TadD